MNYGGGAAVARGFFFWGQIYGQLNITHNTICTQRSLYSVGYPLLTLYEN